MKTASYRFDIVGKTPLLMHQDSVPWSDYLSHERTRLKEEDRANFTPGDDRCPADTWRGYLHHDTKNVAIPADMLQVALRKAGGGISLKGQKTFKALTQSAIFFDALFLEFRCDGKLIPVSKIDAIKGRFADQLVAVRAMGFDLFVKRAAVGRSKHIRVRPRFDSWSITGSLKVNADLIDAAILARLFSEAGTFFGLGDWRPGAPLAPGNFGIFEAKVTTV